MANQVGQKPLFGDIWNNLFEAEANVGAPRLDQLREDRLAQQQKEEAEAKRQAHLSVSAAFHDLEKDFNYLVEYKPEHLHNTSKKRLSENILAKLYVLPTTGVLQSNHKFVYVKIHDMFADAMLPLMKSMGFERTPFYSESSVGTHITVISAQEMANAKTIRLGGMRAIQFKLKQFTIVEPKSWEGIKRAAVIEIESADIEAFRKEKGLPPKMTSGHEFHFTLGVEKGKPVKQTSIPGSNLIITKLHSEEELRREFEQFVEERRKKWEGIPVEERRALRRKQLEEQLRIQQKKQEENSKIFQAWKQSRNEGSAITASTAANIGTTAASAGSHSYEKEVEVITSAWKKVLERDSLLLDSLKVEARGCPGTGIINERILPKLKAISLDGIVQCNGTFVFAKINEMFVEGLLPILSLLGCQKPPFYNVGGIGAHIPVISKSEFTKEIQTNFRMCAVRFQLSKFTFVEPKNWKAVAQAAIIEIESPDIEAIRIKHGLAPKMPGGHKLHFTVGVIKKNS